MPDSVTQLLRSGPPGTKRNLVVVGDGYTEAEQGTFNDHVAKTIIDEVFGRDYFYEDRQAFNLHRINLVSNDSGITRHTYDADGNLVSTDDRDTALDTIYTGRWNRCWIEDGPSTNARLNRALSRWVPDWDFVLIISNHPQGGGCARGNRLYVTAATRWATVAHELGHGLGGLADEYCGDDDPVTVEPGVVNVTKNTNRATLKWRQFVRPITPIPTGLGSCVTHNQGTKPGWWDSNQDVGLFEGARYRKRGLFRPTERCRMVSNTPEFCPVCYTEMKRIHHPLTGRTFERVYTGDFNGDGRDDVLVHTGNAIQMYRSGGSSLELAYSAVDRVPGSWQFGPNDQFVIADFNNDGKDEVLIFNATDWDQEYLGLLVADGNGLRLVKRYRDTMPGWQFNKGDRFLAADLNGDGRKDLIVFNGSDWTEPYLQLMRSIGNDFQFVKRYDTTVEGWQMAKGDQQLIGDFTGDGKDDLVFYNGSDWGTRYLALLRSEGDGLRYLKRYDDELPGWTLAKNDTFHVGDLDGDGRDDLYVFNGVDWSTANLAMLKSNGAGFEAIRRYDGATPGWQNNKHDRHFVADVDGNGRSDLFVYNHEDWDTQYLGVMISSGSSLACTWQKDWVGEWNLGAADQFVVCNYEGRAGSRNLVVHNKDWLGMVRAAPALSLQRMYKQWIHNYRYGRN